MGLDVSFYSAPKEDVAKVVSGDATIDYWDIYYKRSDVYYARKPWQVQSTLDEMFGGHCHQSTNYVLSKLNAYHLLHRIESENRTDYWYNAGRRQEFIKGFREALNNFDFDKNELLYCWVS